ncbi:hypothetical protein BGY98DRAFT_993346 [Russula aff. rugulosa BPL654]|nr:hypothetical protein BGY98DRAFT_993346 [Russula aff. rugulosa BPL654]
MRWYNIVTGILLTLPIVDFALTAPVLVQEKSQARVGAVHIPKDVITGLGKRWDEELENPEKLENLQRMMENYFTTMTSSPSSSALSVPGHGPTNVELLPTQNLASSTANRDPLIEMWSSSSTDVARPPPPPPPPPNQESSTANRDPLVVASNAQGGDDESHGPLYTSSSSSSGYSSDYSSDYGLSEAEEHMYAPQPSYYSIASTDTSADSDFDWTYWMKDTAPPSPASSNEFGQPQEDQVHSPSLGVWSPTEHEHEAVPAPPSTILPGPPSTFG